MTKQARNNLTVQCGMEEMLQTIGVLVTILPSSFYTYHINTIMLQKSKAARTVIFLSFILFTVIFFLCCEIKLFAQEKSASESAFHLPQDIRTFTLSSGLRCYIAHNAKPERRAEIRLVVNVGSLLEDNDQRGLAHFLEHLAFNGSKRFPKQAIVKYLEARGMSFGAHTNAYTSADETVYQMQIPTDSLSVLATALDIVADWSSALTLDSTAIEKERSIVIEEWRMRDLGLQGRVNDSFLSAFYGDSRYLKRLPMGTKSSLDTFRHETVRRFYRDWYAPQNMTLVVVGDIPLDSLERLVREHLAVIPAREGMRNIAQERSAMRLLPTGGDSLPAITIFVDKEMPSTLCETHWRSAFEATTTNTLYRQSVIRNLSLSLVNSRLAERATASAKPPFRSASVRWSPQNRLFGSVALAIEPSDALFTSYEAALVELRRIKRDGFLLEEIARTKAGFQKSIAVAYNERQNIPSAVRADALVNHALTGTLLRAPEEQYRLDSSIVANSSAEELHELVKLLFPIGALQQMTFIAVPPQDSIGISPESVRAVLRRADSAQILSYREDTVQKQILSALPPCKSSIVRERFYARSGVTEWRLSNGVRVLLKPTTFKNDQILIQSVLEGGLSLASEQEYLAAKMAISLQAPSVAGVGELTASELNKVLSGKSVSVTPYADGLYHGMTAVATVSDIETAFQLFYAAQTAPRLDSVSVNIAKQRELQAFGNRANSPFTAYQDTVNAILYGNHYAVRSATLSELKEWNHSAKGYPFYRRLFSTVRGSTVVVVGAFDTAQIKPLILQYIGSLPTKKAPTRFSDINMYPKPGKVDITVRKGSDAQGYTLIAYTGFLPEWTLKFDITADILREIADTKLREALRNDAGGVYASQVSIEIIPKPRPYFQATVYFPSEPERTSELAKRTAALWETFRTSGIQESDLTEAKTKLLAVRETSMKDNDVWLQRLQFWTRQGESPERILDYVPMVEAISLADVRRAVDMVLCSPNTARFVLLPEKSK